MWIFDSSLLLILLRTVIIYVVVLLGLRVAGKREVGQMTPFDLVLLILIANAVQNAMTGGDNSVSGGIVAAGTLLLLNSLVSRLVQRHKGIRRFVEGTPTILIRHGKIIGENLDKEHMNVDELLQALREHGVAGVEDVFSAILEIDGSISVIKREDSPKVEKAIHRFRFIKRK